MRGRKFVQQPRGAVLLLVLGAVAILSVLAIELAHRSQITVSRTSRTARDAAFQRAFDSGVEIARGLLIERRTSQGFDYWGDGWAEPVQVTLDDTQITVQIADESGKLNLSKAMLAGNSAADAAFFRKALIRTFAWLRTHDTGSQTNWDDVLAAVQERLGINTPGLARPLLTLDGLRECALPQELIFGNPKAPDQLALCDFMTVFGDGKINLNTAPHAGIYALNDAFDEKLSAAILQWRGGEAGGPASSYLPFKQARDLESVNGVLTYGMVNGETTITQNLLAKVQERVSVQSTCFSARITVVHGQRHRIAWAFFDLPQTAQPLTAEALKLLSYEEIGL